MLYRWYVEYKDGSTNNHLFVHAKTGKQIEEMFLEYELTTVMIAD